MVLVDYSREWKKYQRDFVRLQIQKTQKDIQQASSSFDRTKLDATRPADYSRSAAQQQQNEAQIEQNPEAGQRSECEAVRRR